VAKPSAAPKTGAERDALSAEVAAWLAARVAQHKRLRGGVVVVEVIPKSPSGKILRKDLRVRAQAERDAETQLRAKV
jgi:acyl-coenzyme A synthetase/AMP-(fatty) acid ligase